MCLLIKPHGRVVQILDLPATAKFALRIVITERIHEAIEETEKTTTSIRIVSDLGLPFVRLAELPDLCSRVQRHASASGQFLLQRVHFLGTGTNLISHPVPSLGQTCGRSGRCEHLFLGERLLPHGDQHLVHLFELLFGTQGGVDTKVQVIQRKASTCHIALYALPDSLHPSGQGVHFIVECLSQLTLRDFHETLRVGDLQILRHSRVLDDRFQLVLGRFQIVGRLRVVLTLHRIGPELELQ